MIPLYDTSDGLTKNDHFRAMLDSAAQRGLQPTLVAFDAGHGHTCTARGAGVVLND
jgi:hypothetical protein